MTIYKLFRKWTATMVGRYVRGQQVEGCEIVIEDDCDEVHVFLVTRFRENPVTNRSPEHNLLEQIFNEIPPTAHTKCLTWKQACRIMRGKVEPEWVLEDELVEQEA